MPSSPPLDELLRSYLATNPAETLSKILNEQQASEKRIRMSFEDHEKKDDERHVFVVEQLAGQRNRIERLERHRSEPPRQLSKDHWEETSKTFTIPKADVLELLDNHDNTLKARRWDDAMGAAGKIAIAIVIAILLFYGGTMYKALVH